MKRFFSKLLSKRLVMSAVVAASVVCMSVSAFAAGTGIETALTSSFQTVVDDMLSVITAILPIALSVFAITAVIGFAIKWFKKIIGKTT